MNEKVREERPERNANNIHATEDVGIEIIDVSRIRVAQKCNARTANGT